MAVPKRRTSKARRDRRRSHHALDNPRTSTCDNCGEAKVPHRVCGQCGHYRGRQVIQVDDLF